MSSQNGSSNSEDNFCHQSSIKGHLTHCCRAT